MRIDAVFALINRGELAAARAALTPLLKAGGRDAVLAAAALETRSGHPRKALALLDRALKAGPDAAVWNAVAIARKALGDVDGARRAYAAARGLEPANPDLVFNHARLEMDHGDRAQAEALLRQAMALRPAPAYARTLAACLMERGAMAEAASMVEAALVPSAADPLLWSYLGIARQRTGDLDGADAAHARALALLPAHPEILNNAATLRTLQRRLDEAEILYRRAIALRPDHAEAHYGLGWVRLTLGDFAGGWPEWEWRLKRAAFRERAPTARLWRGERIAGTLLVHSEIGFGDSLNFLSFVLRAAERCGRVVFACQSALVPLLAGRLPGVEVVDQVKPLPRADRFAYVMSLPGLFVRSFDDIDPRPLLAAEAPAKGTRPRVGLCWTTTRARMEVHKTIPSREFAAALTGLDADFVSLQVGLAHEDKAPVVALAEDREPELTDFAATARVIAGLDAVATIDSAVAHLAGLMGKPTWVLLHRGADWRWFEGDRAPWYSGARLLRQERAGDWSAPLAAMRAALG